LLNGLDLFTGIGGITIAISDWVRPITYCEIDKYAQSIIISRMLEGRLPHAPIFSDIRKLDGTRLRGLVDIIYGGFPCQDISIAGLGKGLEGERSGLFFEILRLVKEIRPSFIFLENVPAIRTRGGERVCKELAEVGYDCRWTTLSAFDVGAPHKRERWFLLAHTKSNGDRRNTGELFSQDGQIKGPQDKYQEENIKPGCSGEANNGGWWEVESPVGRMVDELSHRLDRIKCLGNAVVPLQVRQAFCELIGL